MWSPRECRLGAVVFVHGKPVAAGWADLPAEWLNQLQPRGTQISPAETLGPAVALATWPNLLQDQDIIFFCDNIGAVHSLAGGVANAMDLQVLVSATHAALAKARACWWIEWVPSESNCSDGLSREGIRDPWCQAHSLRPAPLRLPAWLVSLSGTMEQYLNIIYNLKD